MHLCALYRIKALMKSSTRGRYHTVQSLNVISATGRKARIRNALRDATLTPMEWTRPGFSWIKDGHITGYKLSNQTVGITQQSLFPKCQIIDVEESECFVKCEVSPVAPNRPTY